MFGLMRFLFLSVITLGLYQVFVALRSVGRSITGTTKHRKNRTEVHQRGGESPPITRARTSRGRHELIPVSLNEEQIANAKEANGSRKRITHALLCGPHGQMFGTEEQCLKYYLAWRDIFPALFSKSVETTNHKIAEYRSTFDLVNKLIEADDSLHSKAVKPCTQAA